MISRHFPAWRIREQTARTLSVLFPFKVTCVPGWCWSLKWGFGNGAQSMWAGGWMQTEGGWSGRLVPTQALRAESVYLGPAGAVTWKLWEPQSAL